MTTELDPMRTTPAGMFNEATSGDIFQNRSLPSNSRRSGKPPGYRVWQERGDPPGRYRWKAKLNDLAGGLDCIYGSLPSDGDRSYWSTLNHDSANTLTLPTLLSNSAATGITNARGFHAVTPTSPGFFGANALGIGDAANSSLFVRTSSTDPTPVIRTFTPGSPISGLWAAVLGGAANAQYLFIGMLSSAVQVVSDILSPPTSVGAMHANTAACWGMIQTYLNTDTILIYANGSISTLLKTDAVGTAPTITLANVPNGGYALDIIGLPGSPDRAYWVFPNQNNATGILATGAFGRVVSTNLEGTDPQELEFPELKGIRAAAKYLDGVIATDGEQAVWHRGSAGRTTLFYAADADNTVGLDTDEPAAPTISGFLITGNRLGALQYWQNTSSGSMAFQFLSWDAQTGAWLSRSQLIYSASGNHTLIIPSGSYPFDVDNGVAYVVTAEERFYWQYQPTYGKNLSTTYRDLSATAAQLNYTAGYAGFQDTGIWVSPQWELEGLEGWPKTVNEIGFAGDLSARGVSATGTPQVIVKAGGTWGRGATGATVAGAYTGGVTATFGKTTNRVARSRHFGAGAGFSNLQVYIQIDRGTDTDRTPQALPIWLSGYAWEPKGTVPMPSAPMIPEMEG